MCVRLRLSPSLSHSRNRRLWESGGPWMRVSLHRYRTQRYNNNTIQVHRHHSILSAQNEVRAQRVKHVRRAHTRARCAILSRARNREREIESMKAVRKRKTKPKRADRKKKREKNLVRSAERSGHACARALGRWLVRRRATRTGYDWHVSAMTAPISAKRIICERARARQI